MALFGGPIGVYCAGATFVLVVLHLLANKFGKNAPAVAGPYLAGYTRLWRLWDVWAGTSTQTDIQLHNKYGRLVRIGPRSVLVSGSEAIKQIYSPSAAFLKTPFYTLQAPILNGKIEERNLFTLRDPVEHGQLKRVLASSYSVGSLRQMEPLIDEVSEKFFDILHRDFEKHGRDIDLGNWLQWYAFDVIGNITFSKQFGFLESASDVNKSISTIHNYLWYASIIGQVPGMHRYLLANPIVALFQGTAAIAEFTDRALKERTKGDRPDRDSTDFASMYQQLRKEKPDKFSDFDLFISSATNVFAGSDTTAISLRAIVYQLIKHPECLAKLREEMATKETEGNLSPTISFAEAENMPYFQACMKEAMRLHPAVGMPLERYVPPNGATIYGTYLPPGTIVGVNPWVAGRDQEIYGLDAEEFCPERWINTEPERLKRMERNFLAFGAGSRICIGKNISLMEMSKLVPQLFRHFDISLARADSELEVKTFWFAGQTGLVCKLRER